MTPDAPDRDPNPPSHSLAGLVVLRLRRLAGWRPRPGAGTRRPPRLAVLLALLIAAGPLVTTLAAAAMTAQALEQIAALHARLAPRLAAEQARGAARRILAGALDRPGPAPLLDALAAVLPPDASVARAERLANGTLEIEVATSDPDALRAALRRAPALAGLRDVRQQEGEGRTLVLLRRAGP